MSEPRVSTTEQPPARDDGPPQPSSPENANRLTPQPIEPQRTGIQPGGGVVVQIELAWGRWRRWRLKTFRPGYVAKMQKLRRGEANGCPHEFLDSRDLKYYRNQTGYYWDPKDDPFSYRDRLPFARAGLAELLFMGIFPLLVATLLAAWLVSLPSTPPAAWMGWLTVAALGVIGLLIVWFFRDPYRTIPQGEHVVVSPADGKVVTVEEIEHDEDIGGPAVLIGIFLSIFNVHINRMPIAGKIIALRYRPGKCLNALRPESARENEHLAVHLQSHAAPYRCMVVRQITGAIARRIVEIHAARTGSQPIRTRTGGSTFKNPPGGKAWELIDRAGCRGLRRGGAMVSEQHCNFLINTGTATATDIEGLGEDVRARVRQACGVELEWEIRRIGEPLPGTGSEGAR